MPVFISGLTINDEGEFVIDADALAAAGVQSVELIEGEPATDPRDGADCDHPFRVTGDMCLNCGEWDTDLVAIRARIRELEAQLSEAKELLCECEPDCNNTNMATEYLWIRLREFLGMPRIEEDPEVSTPDRQISESKAAALIARAEKAERELASVQRQHEQFARDIAALEARLEAIDNALDDADAPSATDAHALDKDPIVERIKLWDYAFDALADNYETRLADANAKLNTEMAEHTREVLLHAVTKARAEKAEAQSASFRAAINRLETAELAALAKLDEAKAELRDWIENRGPKLAAQVACEQSAEANDARRELSLVLEQAIAQRDDADIRAEKAEAEAARLRKLAVEYMDAEKAYRLAHDRGEAGPGLTIRANKADAALRAALEAPEVGREGEIVFEHHGEIYNRPLGRGICGDDEEEFYLEERFPDGWYQADIVIRKKWPHESGEGGVEK